MRASIILSLVAVLCLAGCGNTTRAEYEAANPDLSVISETKLKNGDAQVVYGPDKDPRIDPVTGTYTCPDGVRIAIYRDGVTVARWFQEHDRLKPDEPTTPR